MNLIDISSWQKGIDLATLFDKNPALDGVIVKATQGTSYTNPEYAGWTRWLYTNGKPFGVYHFLDTGDAKTEAEHFYNIVKPYIGKAIPIADYEGDALYKGAVWLRQFLERFRELSGVRCMIYCSLSVCKTLTGLTDYPLWVAQYADNKTVNGFLDHPWQSGSVAPWTSYVMHQYTSCGRLTGYNGSLDFDLFYGTVDDWNKLCEGKQSAPTPAPTPTPATLKDPDPAVISAILSGRYGVNSARRNALKAAGYDPDKCQTKVNELYSIAAKVKQDVGKNMAYINSIVKIARS